MPTPNDILTYWLPSLPDAAAMAAARTRWFSGSPVVDDEVRERFGPTLEQARRGELDGWATEPRGLLALVIVLDQFSRHLYRGTPQAFSQDPAARALALRAIDAGVDLGFDVPARLFLGLPLEHTEDLAMQHRSVAYFEALAGDAPPPFQELATHSLEFARRHLDPIARFGRFPQRNEALGRASTPEEQAYLADLASQGRRF
jgi:uncharacterized protein (DUF924 family)